MRRIFPSPRRIDPAASACVGSPEPLKERPAMSHERPPRSAIAPGLLAGCLSFGLLVALPALAQGGGGGAGGAGGGGAAGGTAGGATSGTGAAGTGRGGGPTAGTASPGATAPSAGIAP